MVSNCHKRVRENRAQLVKCSVPPNQNHSYYVPLKDYPFRYPTTHRYQHIHEGPETSTQSVPVLGFEVEQNVMRHRLIQPSSLRSLLQKMAS